MYVLCDDGAVRRSLDSLNDPAGWHPRVVASPGEFLLSARPPSPSCLVLDASAPGLDGLDLLTRLAADRIDMPIIFIMGDSDVAMTVKVMNAGVSDVLIRPSDNRALLEAIAQALRQSRIPLTHDVGMRTLHERHATLSRRERQIMALVELGRLNKQIAAELGISEITVKAHRGKMMRKMKAQSVAQLVIMSARIGAGVHLPNLTDASVSSRWIAHGRCSDPGHTGWLERFSNEPHSNTTSAGAHRTGTRTSAPTAAPSASKDWMPATATRRSRFGRARRLVRQRGDDQTTGDARTQLGLLRRFARQSGRDTDPARIRTPHLRRPSPADRGKVRLPAGIETGVPAT